MAPFDPAVTTVSLYDAEPGAHEDWTKLNYVTLGASLADDVITVSGIAILRLS